MLTAYINRLKDRSAWLLSKYSFNLLMLVLVFLTELTGILYVYGIGLFIAIQNKEDVDLNSYILHDVGRNENY